MENGGHIRIRAVKTDAFTMEYFRFGQGDRTLVILPGLSVQSVMGAADAVAEAYSLFADAFTVYVFDRRKELPETYSMRRMAEDTEAAIEALGLERLSLFGASQGGMLAMQIAADRPENVRKLALGSTSPCVTEEQFRGIERWIRFAKEGDAERLYFAFGEAVYPQAVFEQSREALKAAAGTVTAEELRRFSILAESLRGFDITADLGRITCPVLAIGDRDDRVLGAEAPAMTGRYLSGSTPFESFLYDGCGHAAYDTAPDYKERLLKFFLQ